MPNLRQHLVSLLAQSVTRAFPLKRPPSIHLINQALDAFLKNEQTTPSHCKYRTYLPETIFSLFSTETQGCFGLPSSR